MPGDDKAVTRSVAVVVLLVLAIVALRGYLPGAEPASDPAAEPATSGPGSLIAIAAMLGVSITVITISVISQSRRRMAAQSAAELPREYRGERVGVPWRLLLITGAGLLAWLLVILLLMRWSSGFAVDGVPADDPEAGDVQDAGGPDATPPTPPAEGGDVFGYLAAATIVLLVLSIAATILGRRRITPLPEMPVDADDPRPAPPVGPDLARATELGLAEMDDLSRDPREAIISCYAAMERELAKSPGTTPQDFDTPSEVLARAVQRHALRADSAAELVELFEEARFSPHVMNEDHRADAVRALRLVQHELQGAV
ncbi:MAG: DUF4129 domain-containing protein [Mycobacterium sp.]|nr:DUF4129 domain-containing protein [Mycobacterium sp.]